MDIFAAGSRPTQRAPKEYFTGTVWQDPIVAAPAPARLAATRVAFEPGARTAWHTHPLGQTIHVTQGVGLCQREGGPVEVIRTGDRVYFEPGEHHWHGAAPNRLMVHIAIQETDGTGSAVSWGRHVTDAEYGGPTAA
jgi:quercetin dioxygenase-like cupin family protein